MIVVIIFGNNIYIYIYVAIRFYDTDWALSGPGNN